MKLVAALVLGALTLGGCAGRDAHPVATVGHFDQALNCAQLQAEISRNNRYINQLVDEKNGARERNVAVGVVGALLFWPALFALDLSNAEEVEINALNNRNMYLVGQANRKDCNESAVAFAQ